MFRLAILFTVLGAGLLAWAVPGSGEPRAAATKPQKIWVQDNFFDRRSIQIAPNEKVVWVWKGMNRHNVRFTKVPKGAQRGGSKTQDGGRPLAPGLQGRGDLPLHLQALHGHAGHDHA